MLTDDRSARAERMREVSSRTAVLGAVMLAAVGQLALFTHTALPACAWSFIRADTVAVGGYALLRSWTARLRKGDPP